MLAFGGWGWGFVRWSARLSAAGGVPERVWAQADTLSVRSEVRYALVPAAPPHETDRQKSK